MERYAQPILDELIADAWQKAGVRYHVKLVVDEYGGFKDVSFLLFKTSMTDEEKARLREEGVSLIGMNGNVDEYILSQVAETFSKREVQALYEYFKDLNGMKEFKLKRATAPASGYIGVSELPIGGGTDFIMFSETDGYSLDFKVWGYVDLRRHERIKPIDIPDIWKDFINDLNLGNE